MGVKRTGSGHAPHCSLFLSPSNLVAIYCRRLEHGYPTPSLGRDAVLKQSLPWLRSHNIWSRGRFGAYKYEVANQVGA